MSGYWNPPTKMQRLLYWLLPGYRQDIDLLLAVRRERARYMRSSS